MKSNVNAAITVSLTLSEEEANWLHQAMQNPLWEHDPSKEDPKDKQMRESFFHATKTTRPPQF